MAQVDKTELSAPAILLISLAFASLCLTIYTVAIAASGNFDLASHSIYAVQPQSVVR
jgi:hypothetical protein